MASHHGQGLADGQLPLISGGSDAHANRKGVSRAQLPGRDQLGLLTSTMQLSILALLGTTGCEGLPGTVQSCLAITGEAANNPSDSFNAKRMQTRKLE